MTPENHQNASVLNTLVVLAILSAILVASLPGGNFVNTGISGLLAAGTAFYILAGRRSLWNSPELLMVLVWLTYALIPSIFAPNQEQAMFKAISMLQVMLLVYFTLQIIIWKDSSRVFMWAYIVAMCISYLVTFTVLNEYIKEVSIDVEGAGGTLRTASTLANAVTFGVAAVLAQSLILIVITLRSTSKTEKAFAIIAFLILTGATINSGSRTAMAGSVFLLTGSIWVFSLWRPHSLMRLVLWAGVIAILSGGFIYLIKDIEQVQTRYHEIAEGGLITRITDFVNLLSASGENTVERSGESLDARLGLAKMAWQTAQNYPFGVGLDNFSEFSGVYAHSNYLELLATTGFPGLIIYYLCYFFIVFKAMQIWLRFPHMATPKAIILGVAVLGLMDIQNVSYYVKTVWLFLAILIATLEILHRKTIVAANQHYVDKAQSQES